MVVLYTLAAVIIVSLVSLVGIFSLMLRKEKLNDLLLILVSLSAGTLFGGAFIHLLPEAVEDGFTLQISLSVLAGVLVFFLLEKLVHMRRCEIPPVHKYSLVHHEHPHHLGIMNLVGDGIHNFVDGLIIAGSFLVSIPVGIATTIAVILHEVPQELADFGVLLYAGYTKKKALILNFLSAAVAILGAVVGLILGAKTGNFVKMILPFAAGGFIYIAGSDLVPELHKECGWKDTFWHFLVMFLGIGIMLGVTFLHGH